MFLETRHHGLNIARLELINIFIHGNMNNSRNVYFLGYNYLKLASHKLATVHKILSAHVIPSGGSKACAFSQPECTYAVTKKFGYFNVLLTNNAFFLNHTSHDAVCAVGRLFSCEPFINETNRETALVFLVYGSWPRTLFTWLVLIDEA